MDSCIRYCLSVSDLHPRVPKGGVDTQILPCMAFHPFYRVCTTCQTALRAAGSLPLCQQSLMKAFSSFCEKHNILFFLVNVIYCGSRGSNSRPRVSQANIPPPNDTHNLTPSPSLCLSSTSPAGGSIWRDVAEKLHHSTFMVQNSRAPIYYGHGTKNCSYV